MPLWDQHFNFELLTLITLRTSTYKALVIHLARRRILYAYLSLRHLQLRLSHRVSQTQLLNFSNNISSTPTLPQLLCSFRPTHMLSSRRPFWHFTVAVHRRLASPRFVRHARQQIHFEVFQSTSITQPCPHLRYPHLLCFDRMPIIFHTYGTLRCKCCVGSILQRQASFIIHFTPTLLSSAYIKHYAQQLLC